MSEIEEFDDDDVTPGQTELVFEECHFYEESLYGNSLEEMITERLDISYSAKQQFVMLVAANGSTICLRPETITKIKELCK